ncbi:MAG: hypothetical protein HDT22_05430 [Ruminococcus sp.]|nr:hypothetical protein [Ruminococcus sp.]
MLKFFRETKAYTSIFLCLILLPMVTYSSMIIDASRLQSARVQVQSAGDLAINAAMSEYEKILEDMYGLFANAKTNDEKLKKSIENYFTETISGVIGESEDPYVKQFISALADVAVGGNGLPEDAEFTNFLQLQLADQEETNPAFVFQPVESSAISNANIMKGQIIDYMKYKGPVSVGSNFLNKLGFLQDTKAQSEAIQQKIELTQEIADLDKPMENAYNAIKEYNATVESFNDTYYNETDPNKIFNMIFYDTNWNLDVMSRLYLCQRYLNNLMKQYCNDKTTISYNEISTDNIELSLDTSWREDADLNHNLSEEELANESLDNAMTRLDKFEAWINQFVYLDSSTFSKAADQFSSGFESRYGIIDYSFGEDGEAIVNFNNNIDKVEYYATYGNLTEWNATLNLFNDPEEEHIFNTRNETFALQLKLIPNISKIAEYKAYRTYFTDLRNLYVQKYIEYQDIYALKNPDADTSQDETYKKYSKICSLVMRIDDGWESSNTFTAYKNFLRNLNNGKYAYIADHYREKADDEFVAYYNVIKKLESTTDTAVKNLNNLINQVGGVESKADSLTQNINTNVKDDSAKTQMKSDVATLKESVSKEDITQLRDVLQIYHERFESLKEKLESVHYFNTDKDKLYSPYATWGNIEYRNREEYNFPVSDNITDADKLYSEFTSKYSNINNTEIIVDFYSGTPQPDFKDGADKIDGGKHTINGTEYDECFYNVLRNTEEAEGQSDSTDATTSESKNTLEIAKSVSGSDVNPEKSEFTVKDTSSPETPAVTVPTSGTQTEFSAAVSEISSGTSETYESASAGDIPDAGTDADNAKKSAENGKENLSKANDLLKAIAEIGDKIKDNIYLEEYFTEMFTCLTDKKLGAGELQLINGYSNDSKKAKFINPSNDWYGAEMEYILWGDSSIENNLNTTATTIFLLRFAINAVYAFTAADIQSMATAAAELLVGWTVVLVPVVQVCITLAIALAESAIDLEMLKNGEDVPIIKDSSTFMCSPTGIVNSVADTVIDKATTKISDYVSNKIDETIDGIENAATTEIKDCVDKIDEALQSYVDQQANSITSAISSQFTTPLVTSITPILSRINETTDTAFSNADAVTNEIIETTWKEIENNISNMNEGIIKKYASDALENAKSDKDELIEKIANEIKNAQQNATLPSPDSIKNVINDKVKAWVDTIINPVKTELSEMKESMKNEIIDNHGGELATNLKSYMHEQIDNVGQELSGVAKDTIKDAASQVAENTISTKSTSVAAKVTMNYKEYCKLFMFIGLVSSDNQSKMLQRAAVLMQLNVNYAVKGGETVEAIGNTDFHMNNAYTLFYISANMKMGTLFPWAVKLDDNGTEVETSLDFSNLGTNYVNLKYSSIAGY